MLAVAANRAKDVASARQYLLIRAEPLGAVHAVVVERRADAQA